MIRGTWPKVSAWMRVCANVYLLEHAHARCRQLRGRVFFLSRVSPSTVSGTQGLPDVYGVKKKKTVAATDTVIFILRVKAWKALWRECDWGPLTTPSGLSHLSFHSQGRPVILLPPLVL